MELSDIRKFPIDTFPDAAVILLPLIKTLFIITFPLLEDIMLLFIKMFPKKVFPEKTIFPSAFTGVIVSPLI